MTLTEADSALLTRVLGRGDLCYDAACRRARELQAVGHRAVLAPERVFARSGGEVVATMPRLDGMDVSQILTTRGSMTAGECVWLGVQLAEGLAAMHAKQMAHGDVSPANVVVTASGAVLVDTVGSALAGEVGTPPFSAPERRAGPTAQGDVYSLGVLLLECVRDADRELIAAWVDPMIAADPLTRPQAFAVARALPQCAAPQPIQVPHMGVVEHMRARSHDPATRTIRLDSARWWRWRRTAARVTVVLAAGVVTAAFLITTITRTTAVIAPNPTPGFDPPMPIPANAAVAPEVGAAQVTLARFDALVAGDGQALLATTVPESLARRALIDQAKAVSDGTVVYEGLTAEVTSTKLLSFVGRKATVVVAYEVSQHTVIMNAEATRVGGFTQSVQLDLRWSQEGWQVERARPRE